MKLPEVKQCTDEKSHLLGAVAVKSTGGQWGVMHPKIGGHWATDAEVADWQPMTGAAE